MARGRKAKSREKIEKAIFHAWRSTTRGLLDADHAYTYLLEAFVQVSSIKISTIMSDE
ncbi:unnamed protein product [Fusarium graminearum]|uniref:Chromosome 3, complete genome n=1 Tax=Gibberella zeae (strain ATCC MYA-4620 / CBS 123657 / FGSC 9075 / NRRL 31084 / PH-1) TaxID=229533 RepID=A0A098E125_GIBZE|nr:unnamed protein product [Fusarium graminearum]